MGEGGAVEPPRRCTHTHTNNTEGRESGLEEWRNAIMLLGKVYGEGEWPSIVRRSSREVAKIKRKDLHI